MSTKMRFEQKPEKNYIVGQSMFFSTITLLKNITELTDEQGKKYYEADTTSIELPTFSEKSILDNYEWYWDEGEKQEKTKQIQALTQQLEIIDEKSTRPLRAIQAGKGTDADIAKLAELETQAETIRKQIQDLKK